MGKLSAFPTETTFTTGDAIPKIKATGGGDVQVTLANFMTALYSNGVWMQELARVSLGTTAANMNSGTFTAKTFLRVIVFTINSGSTDVLLQFNGDTGTNYSFRYIVNGGGETTAVSASAALLGSTEASIKYSVFNIINVSGSEKVFEGLTVSGGTPGASNLGSKWVVGGKWANTSTQITSVNAFTDQGSTDFLSGSYVIVLGHN